MWGAESRLGGVYNALTRPFTSDAERLSQTRSTIYALAQYAQTDLDPQTDVLCLMDARLAYYLSAFDVVVGYPLELADVQGCEFLFHHPSIYAVYGDGRLGWENSEFYLHAFDPLVFEPVYVVDGVHVMRVLRTDVPSPEEYDAFNAAHSGEP
jgi:hypothetical protein